MTEESDYLLAARLARECCERESLSAEATQLAVEMAMRSPVSAIGCYSAILRSLVPR